MPAPTHPWAAIGPIVKMADRDDGQPAMLGFLGTGFTVGDGHTLVTAGHVLDGQEYADDEYPAILWIQHGGGEAWSVRIFEPHVIDRRIDLATGTLIDNRFVPLDIATADVPNNSNLLMTEYSSTERHQPTPDAPWEFNFWPLYRKGNALRYFTDDRILSGRASVIELSVPCLKGASGAPIIAEETGEVVGVAVMNIDRELLPSQVYRYESPEEGEIEEIKYMVPHGIAVSWIHLREILGLRDRPSGIS